MSLETFAAELQARPLMRVVGIRAPFTAQLGRLRSDGFELRDVAGGKTVFVRLPVGWLQGRRTREVGLIIRLVEGGFSACCGGRRLEVTYLDESRPFGGPT